MNRPDSGQNGQQRQSSNPATSHFVSHNFPAFAYCFAAKLALIINRVGDLIL